MRRRRAMERTDRYEVLHVGATGRVVRRGRRVTVGPWEQGLVFRHGRSAGVIGPGAHRRWRAGSSVRLVDLRPWVIVVPTQEVPTADGATVKATVAGQARICDAATFVGAARDGEQALYLALQVALRELAATATLDDLLTRRAEMGDRLRAGVRGLDALGMTVDHLELKDVVLPAELKRARNDVLMARSQGAAALERARGETAALRSLANAARMAADTPALLQLRLLQQLEASTGHTVVIGSQGFAPAASTGEAP